MKLFIVESPSKCGKIRKYLGDGYKVSASVGHIRSIPQKGMNIDIKGGFVPIFEVSKDKKQVVKELKDAASKADQIILATDPDREGEAISWHIMEVIGDKNKSKCVRVTFDEITKSAVTKAIDHPRSLDMNLVDAQKARQVLDRLIGYKISPILWFTVGPKTSAGRVQSIALKLICDRHKEIEAFKPEDFWYLEALLENKNGEFWAKVITKDKDNRLFDEKLSQNALEQLKRATYGIDSIKRNTKERSPYPPFDTTSLQSACSSLFGWSATKSMKVAQSLYEQGKVSYIRSDSYNISKEAMDSVRELIDKKSGAKYLPSKPNVYKKKSTAAAQEAHECIRPTDIYDDASDLDSDEERMYNLIRDRFIACQMTPMVVDMVTYNIKTNTSHKLIAKGQTIKFDGWYKVYRYSKAKEETLPDADEKETLKLNDTKLSKHTTQPPPKYNDGSLVQKMEADGVGRPATRASIIKSIQDKGYVIKEKGNKGGFLTTDLGLKVCDFLAPRFKDFFMDIKFTASLEEDLDLIAHGKKTFMDVVDKVYKFMMEEIKKAKLDAPEKPAAESTGVQCMVCKKGEIVKKPGRYGEFYACNNYPSCKTIYKHEDDKFTIKKKSLAKKTGRTCPDCEKHGRSGELVERKNKSDGNSFIGCSNYPACKYSESIK